MIAMPRLLANAIPCRAIVALSLGLAFLGCSPSQRDEQLVVGMELSYPPFEMTDAQNRPTGVSVDIAQALGEYLGKEVVIENIPFDGLIPALKTGKIDLILSSMTATEARAQSIDFSDPYLSTGLCLLVPADSDVQSFADLQQPGRKVAVKQGTTGHIYAAEHLPEADLIILDKETEAVLEVSQGKVDAFIYDQMSTYTNWQKRADSTRAILKPFKQESWAIGIRKGNDELRQQVNAFLDEFREKGGFEELGDKYLGEQKEAFERLGYPFYF